MACSADPTSAHLAPLLEQLRERLESAHELALVMREQLVRGATDEMVDCTARLETVTQEFKLIAEEYRRLRSDAPHGEADPRLVQARRELELAAARIARSSALSGGLLERLVAVSRGRLDLFGAARNGTYARDGRVSELDARGARIKEWG